MQHSTKAHATSFVPPGGRPLGRPSRPLLKWTLGLLGLVLLGQTARLISDRSSYSLVGWSDEGPSATLAQGGLPPTAPLSGRSNNGLTTDIEWDHRSLFIKGQRVFLYSGEIHPWRLPVPGLWQDLTEKVKAAGFNAVSIYVNWALVNPSKDVLDWNGYRDLQPFLDFCQQSGLWVVLRPGPHIQAEVSAGGIAYFALNNPSELRTNATDYRDAWRAYVEEVGEVARRNQVSERGSIIAVQVENEYYSYLMKDGDCRGDEGEPQWNKIAYMEELKTEFRRAGIVVPLTVNDVGFESNYLNGPADLYGWDGYPQGFDCSIPDDWHALPDTWQKDHARLDRGRPSYTPEFQGGAFDPWGGVGYRNCARLTGAEFERVFYQGGLWASNVKMMSLYMLYGGTSWGHLPFPGVYTSYDYGAAIDEHRRIGSKYDELKLQGLFLRNSADFAGTDFIANSTTVASLSNTSDVLVVQLSNKETSAGFYIARHSNSSSTAHTGFGLTVETSKGSMVLGNLLLWGRDARMIYTDYVFGHTHVLFTTGTIALSTVIGGVDVLLLHGRKGMRDLYFSLVGVDSFDQELVRDGSAVVTAVETGKDFTTFQATLPLGPPTTAFRLPGNRLVLLADSASAATYWQPTLKGEGPWGSYAGVGTNETILVAGPHLVRKATYVDRTTIALRGDLSESVMLWVFARREVVNVSWNGRKVDIVRNQYGGLEGPLVVHLPTLAVPALDWKYRDALPEIKTDFDDSSWTPADKTTSPNPFWPTALTDTVLFAGEYGFHGGNVLWRGRFDVNDSSSPFALGLVVATGWGGAVSIYLNDHYVGSNQSLGSDSDELHLNLDLPESSIKDGENIATVLQDHQGYPNDGNFGGGNDDFKKPRGIMSARLSHGARFKSWRVQGTLGGEDYPDRVRGVNNEGGLFGERAGWHLPGYEDSDWEDRSPTQGQTSPSVAFFRTSFKLDIPCDTIDVPVSLAFSSDAAAYRVLVFVNGWKVGKLHSLAGPQLDFPLHPGLLKVNGENTLVLALWSLGTKEEDLRIGEVSLRYGNAVEGGIGCVESDNPAFGALRQVL